MTLTLKDLLPGGVVCGLIVGAFILGDRCGTATLQNSVLACEAKAEGALNEEKAAHRECRDSVGQLQAVLKLADADRNRLLEATAIAPALRVTYDGKPFAGRLLVKDAGNTCFQPALLIENTGLRDVVATGIEVLTQDPFCCGYEIEASRREIEKDADGASVYRTWLDLAPITMPPGYRRLHYINVCRRMSGSVADIKWMKSGEEAPVSLTVLSSGNLPLRLSATLVAPPGLPAQPTP